MFERIILATLALVIVLGTAGFSWVSYTNFMSRQPQNVVANDPPPPPPPEAPLSISAEELKEYPLRLKVSSMTRGATFTVVVEGAARNERVWILVGTRPGVAGCSGRFGNQCEAIADFRVMGSVAADTRGIATWTGRVPRDHSGMLMVQAGVMRGPGGSESMLSNVDGSQVQ